MNEKTQITVLFIVTFLIGLVAVIIIGAIPANKHDFEGGVIVDSYEAIWYQNGTLVEKLEYNVSSYGCRMLYRYWGDPLLPAADTAIDYKIPVIELTGMKIPNGTVGYANYQNSKFEFFENKGINYGTSFLKYSNDNEIGIFIPGSIYAPGKFQPGIYTVECYYKFYPLIEYDDETAHLNLMLAKEHNLPYRNVKITLLSDSIISLYTKPPGYEVAEDTDKFVITGRSPRGGMIAVDLFMETKSAEKIPGYRKNIPEIVKKTEFLNSSYLFGLSSAGTILDFAKFAVIIVPLLFILLYTITGREKKYSVPEYLSFLPNRDHSPWEVNLIFKGDSFISDENGFYATILDLHRKGFIRIREKKKSKNGVLIRLIKRFSDDPYEQEVINFISMHSFDGSMDTAHFEEIANNARYSESNAYIALVLKEHVDSLAKKKDPSISRKYARNGRIYLIPFLITGMILVAVSIVMYKLTYDALQEYIFSAVLGGFICLQATVALLFPSTLFGHWKEDYYKEKLEWDSFGRMLSDLSQLKKYAPSDLDIWNEWLVYGTALGAGKNVANAMDQMDMSIEFFYREYFLNKIIKITDTDLFSLDNQDDPGGR